MYLFTQYYEKPGVPIQMQHKNFLASLNDFLETIGPSFKLEESWSSSHYFNYGKYPILKRVPLTMSLKKICGCGRLKNEGTINLDYILNSISANVSYANLMTHNAVVPTIHAFLESLKAIELCLNRPFHGPSMIN